MKRNRSMNPWGVYIPMFTAALLATVNMGKQPEPWMKVGSTSTVEHQSTIKKNEILSLAATRLELEDTMVTKRVWPSSCSPLRSGREDAGLCAEEMGCTFQDLERERR